MESKRFIKEYCGNGCQIYIDIKTGVNYLFISFQEGGGLTPLLDKEGKPIIAKIK